MTLTKYHCLDCSWSQKRLDRKEGIEQAERARLVQISEIRWRCGNCKYPYNKLPYKNKHGWPLTDSCKECDMQNEIQYYEITPGINE